MFYRGLIVTAAGLPLSNTLMSIGQGLLLLDFILNFSQYNFKKLIHVHFLALPVLYFIHVLWLINTENFQYAFHDLRIKLPLLIIPLLVFSKENIIPEKIKKVSFIWVAAVVLATITGVINYHFNLSEYSDLRKLSPFISHIRLSLMINCGIAFLWLYKTEFRAQYQFAVYIIIIWLVGYLVMLQSLNGLIILMLILVFFLERAAIKKSRKLLIAINVLLLIMMFIGIRQAEKYYRDNFILSEQYFAQLPEQTINGRLYEKIENYWETENGHSVHALICKEELLANWSKMSTIPLEGKDRKGQYIYYTLIRYMTSKGLSKDSLGLTRLTAEDIEAVENGVTNYKFKDGFLLKRLYVTLWEWHTFKNKGYVGKSSSVRRWLYWKTAFAIIQNHFWWGTGTGDVADAYKTQYAKNNLNLLPEDQKRAHNQFITFFVTFGFIGGMITLILLAFPFYRNRNLMFLIFYGIALLSFITEDTLETQAGVTFFAFLYALFYLLPQPKLNPHT
ncbi:MAG: O-antigen ligase domain-containing protein [Bacteroidetes bacterium]|nr:MAG: O-antigen ligase domain-containing protein [Bacteroidota bacterium]